MLQGPPILTRTDTLFTYATFCLALAVIGFAIGIGVGLSELYRQRSALEVEPKINAWLMAQTELELQRLIGALDRYVSDVDPASHDDLVMRFDLFWSRLPVLQSGRQSEALRQLPGFDATVLRIQADLHAVEDDVLLLRPDDIAARSEEHTSELQSLMRISSA